MDDMTGLSFGNGIRFLHVGVVSRCVRMVRVDGDSVVDCHALRSVSDHSNGSSDIWQLSHRDRTGVIFQSNNPSSFSSIPTRNIYKYIYIFHLSANVPFLTSLRKIEKSSAVDRCKYTIRSQWSDLQYCQHHLQYMLKQLRVVSLRWWEYTVNIYGRTT